MGPSGRHVTGMCYTVSPALTRREQSVPSCLHFSEIFDRSEILAYVTFHRSLYNNNLGAWKKRQKAKR